MESSRWLSFNHKIFDLAYTTRNKNHRQKDPNWHQWFVDLFHERKIYLDIESRFAHSYSFFTDNEIVLTKSTVNYFMNIYFYKLVSRPEKKPVFGAIFEVKREIAQLGYFFWTFARKIYFLF